MAQLKNFMVLFALILRFYKFVARTLVSKGLCCLCPIDRPTNRLNSLVLADVPHVSSERTGLTLDYGPFGPSESGAVTHQPSTHRSMRRTECNMSSFLPTSGREINIGHTISGGLTTSGQSRGFLWTKRGKIVQLSVRKMKLEGDVYARIRKHRKDRDYGPKKELGGCQQTKRYIVEWKYA